MDVERSFSPSNIKFANCQAPFSHEMLLHMIYFFFFITLQDYREVSHEQIRFNIIIFYLARIQIIS